MPQGKNRSYLDQALRAIGSADKELALSIELRSRSIREKGFVSVEGALIDSIDSEEVSEDIKIQARTFAAASLSEKTVDKTRRSFLKWLARACTGAALAGTSGWALYSYDAYNKTDYSDEFILEILRLGADRQALYRLRDSLNVAGSYADANLIHLVTRHGESFLETERSIATLRKIIDTSNLSEIVDLYLRIVYATHFRYIGLARANFEAGRALQDLNYPDHPDLQVMILNQRHMNMFNIFYGREGFDANLEADNRSLAKSYYSLLGIPIDLVSPEHVGAALEASIKTFGLCSMAHVNTVITQGSEREAIDAFENFLPLLENLACRSADAENDDLILRTYAEALWPIGRIAPFAIAFGWNSLAPRLLSLFFEGFPQSSTAVQMVHKRVFEVERDSQRSPIWGQMAILRILWDQRVSKTGEGLLDSLLPRSRRHRIRRHAVLARALAALEVSFGKNPDAIPAQVALPRVEAQVLLDAAAKLIHGK